MMRAARQTSVRALRLLLVIWIIATIHFTLMLALGVMAFLTQGDLDHPRPPSLAHRVTSTTTAVLEFPFVWAVRRVSPERHENFTRAAIATSLLWGLVIWAGYAVWSRSAQARA
jgi:hypothetical protein